MQKRRNTSLNAALADWDEKFLPDGRKKTFSVSFVTKHGDFIHIPKACKAGLKANMKANDLKAAQPCDENGNPAGHVYPVWIHAILYYSGNVEFDAKKL